MTDPGRAGRSGDDRVRRGWLRESADPLLAGTDAVLLDLDGTVYVGPAAVPRAATVLTAVRSAGVRLAFVTNNASLPAEDVAARLVALGVPAAAAEVVTSAEAAAGLLAERLPAGSRVLVVGGAGLTDALRVTGLVPVASADDAPAAVVQGWAPELDWAQLAEGAYALAAGVPWVACNDDATIPTGRGIAPGNGSFVALLSAVTGRTPDAVAGKPAVPLLQRAALRLGARRALVVGDRLDTDVAGAANAGLPSLLVLTGVTAVADLLAAAPGQRPTYLSPDLGGLLVHHPAPVQAGGRWRCRQAWAEVSRAGELRVKGSGPDVLRAACAAAWSAADVGAPMARTGGPEDVLLADALGAAVTPEGPAAGWPPGR
ncbi:MAG: HAD-IIA family hydrolase [Actinomycetia bacterium]|nr:HAD-IIA family hydrolase [Actinomycetes bacterium]